MIMEYQKEDNISGIYFLKKAEKIVYVGQSVNVHARVYFGHIDKDFDSYEVKEYPQEELDKREQQYIKKLKPIYNRTLEINRFREKIEKGMEPELITLKIPGAWRARLKVHFKSRGLDFSNGVRLALSQYMEREGLI